jgi:hypothetical protein
MTVELTYTGDVTGLTESEATTLIGEVLAQHEETSSTSGTYHAENNTVQPVRDGDGFDVHIGISLRDADDADYPDVKDDLAAFVAGLSVDLGTQSEIKDELYGSME